MTQVVIAPLVLAVALLVLPCVAAPPTGPAGP